ncbi:EcsC family protein [Solitalea lacus]|uniref:EcsC family protein n=1 Tax=Solitalea lacus TaxID=2911172 RepID=UPI001EDAAEF0|nr:EcsC family protein [Solitalea lacus]UKJ06151.1 EcsC family protein [Solitalea lacus]
MISYEQQILNELEVWKLSMQRNPSLSDKFSKSVQTRINRLIPEKVHQVLTSAIKQMIRGVLAGAEFINPVPHKFTNLEETEIEVKARIDFYSKTATAEGALTGAGGILWSFADFPLWLSIKIKMLFEIASIYGFDTSDYKERIYILHIFMLTFSSRQHRKEVYQSMANWTDYSQHLPNDIHQFDWRSFQQEYRDYIDLAKLIQLIPGIGAVTGAYINHKLTNKLGIMAMNTYRMRMNISKS